MATEFVAGDASSQATFTGGNDGAMTFRVGPNGAKVDAISINSGGVVAIPNLSVGVNMRNKIINGDMTISQRGTSFAAIAAGSYSLDRWSYNVNTVTAVATVTQQADAPSNNEFQSSLRYAVTTADSSIATADLAYLEQPIEGFNARDLIGRTFTLSFWVRSSKTGAHCASFINSGGDRSWVVEYTINAANTWEFKTVTVSGGLITTGTWNWTNGIGLRVRFVLAAGATYQTVAGAWQTGSFLSATANQVNCLDAIGNIFAITGVQLEVGSVATPFEHRPYGMELALCRRYFRQCGYGAVGNVTGASKVAASIQFDGGMRVAPTLSLSGSAVSFTVAEVTKSATSPTITAQTSGINGAYVVVSTFATDSSFADQRTANAASDNWLNVSAEL